MKLMLEFLIEFNSWMETVKYPELSQARVQGCETAVAMVAYLCDMSSSGFLESGFAGNEALDCWPVGLATLE